MPVPEHDGMSLFKPGRIAGTTMGLKVVNIRPGNAPAPTVPAAVMLFDEKTGRPECVMDATLLTAMRTAAGSGVATRLVAPLHAASLVVYGAGMQAEQHVAAMCCVRPISDVTIVNRSRARAEELAQKLRSSVLPSICTLANASEYGGAGSVPSVNVVASCEEDGPRQARVAVERADLICMCTNSFVPLFEGGWLKPGCHVNGVGSYTPDMVEVDAETVRRAHILIDTADAVTAGDLYRPLADKVITRDGGSIVSELGPLVQQAAGARDGAAWVAAVKAATSTSAEAAAATEEAGGINEEEEGAGAEATKKKDITFFKSVGTAVQDICTGAAVLAEAKARNVGAVAAL